MNETHRSWGGKIRKIWPVERQKFEEHLLRLDKPSRQMRFAHAASDRYIREYASRFSGDGTVAYGFFDDGEIRAAAELKKISDAWGREAEAAFSVESGCQGQGLGTELMGRVIKSARNRGIRLLFMSCLAENEKMQKIAKHYEADLRFEYGEIVGEIVPDNPNYFSMLSEAMEDRVGYMMAVLDIQARLNRAA